ncbi:MAG: acyl-CoA thioesterase [Hydrogenibacillus sp.]|nr:acyl-CoA thioesterase [Hydrogenibacillus sp.]
MGIPFIDEPLERWAERFRFYRPFKVRFGEIDAFGHVNNVVYFRYFEQARIEYLAHLGVFREMFEGSTSSIIVAANLEAHYLAPVYFDEQIDVGVKAERIGRSSIDLSYVVRRPSGASCARDGATGANVDVPRSSGEKPKVVAVGRGTIVHVDRASGKSLPVPDDVRRAVETYERLA